MSSRRLAEETVSLIEAHIKANIAAALANVRTERADAKVSTEVPKSYFRFAEPLGYRTPAVFTICQGMTTQEAEGANFVKLQADVLVSALVEDRTKDTLLLKTWRYQAALHKILHLTHLTSSDNKVKLICKVTRINFSPEFSDTKDGNAPQSVFRKEVSLELEVEHSEQLDI